MPKQRPRVEQVAEAGQGTQAVPPAVAEVARAVQVVLLAALVMPRRQAAARMQLSARAALAVLRVAPRLALAARLLPTRARRMCPRTGRPMRPLAEAVPRGAEPRQGEGA